MARFSALLALVASALFLSAAAAPVPLNPEVDLSIEVRSSLIDLNLSPDISPNVDLSDLVDLNNILTEDNLLSAPVNSDHGADNRVTNE